MIWKNEFLPGVNLPQATLEVIDARRIRLNSKGTLVIHGETVYSGGVAIAATYSTITFEVNGKKISYLVSEIYRETRNSVLLLASARNKTSIFILPLTGLARKEIGFDTFLFNAYLSPDAEDEFLHLKYRYFPVDEYRRLEFDLCSNPQFVSMQDEDSGIRGNSTITITMQFEKKVLETIHLFRQGLYSKISDSQKKAILKFHNVSKESLLYAVLYKTEDYRYKLSQELAVNIKKGAELYDIPSLEEEVLLT